MLTIRHTQLEAFRQHAIVRFIDRTLAQFHKYFPGPCYVIGNESIRKMISLGIERAAKYNINRESNVSLYASAMLLCGSFFDEDPQYPWACQVLTDEKLKTEDDRAEHLYDAFTNYWQRVAGENRRNLMKTALRTCNQSIESFDILLSSDVADYLKKAWPEKAAELGERGLGELLHEAKRRAAKYRLMSCRDHFVTSILIFTLGIGFDKDPLHPWAADVLNSLDVLPEQRGTRLYEVAQGYAASWVKFAKSEVG